jgi:hypothetical protein
MELKFQVKSNWSEEQIANRLAQIVGLTEGCPPFTKDSGYRWQLNASNNWWMDYDPEKREVTLAYRYDHDGLLKSMKQFLEWVFG